MADPWTALPPPGSAFDAGRAPASPAPLTGAPSMRAPVYLPPGFRTPLPFDEPDDLDPPAPRVGWRPFLERLRPPRRRPAPSSLGAELAIVGDRVLRLPVCATPDMRLAQLRALSSVGPATAPSRGIGWRGR